MLTFAAITSQGQITIPAKFRRQLGLQKNMKVALEIEGDKISIKQIPDIRLLAGSLSEYGNQYADKSADEMTQIENEAIADAIADRHKKRHKE